MTFTPELVYAAVRDDPPANEELIALIGVSFRLASSALIFTSDVMTNFGFIKPANEILTPNTNLDTYLQVSLRVGLTDYFHEYMWPFYEQAKLTTALTREQFAQLQSLTSIQSYLAKAQKIGVVSNRDDVILERGEIEFLTDTFGARAKIYPTGGHLGNLEAARGDRLHGAVLQALITACERIACVRHLTIRGGPHCLASSTMTCIDAGTRRR